MIPRPDNRLDRSLRLHQHVGDVVAIAVLQAADQESRSRDLAQRPHALAPERTIVLMLQVEQRPRRGIEARPQDFFVERVIRRAHPALGHVHVQFEFVDVRHPVDVVNIVVKQFRGRMRPRQSPSSAGGCRIAICIAVNPPHEMPNMPTLPLHHG